MSEPTPADRVYRDRSVRLGELAALEDVLAGFTFENCEIFGPAVIVLLGETLLDRCRLAGDPNAVIWPAYGRAEVVGAIGLLDCVLRNCQFYRVGILVPDEQLAIVRAGFGLG